MTIRADFLSATIAVLLVQAAQAATLIPIPLYPNSHQMRVTGINNNNVFTGGYNITGQSESAFFGTVDGNYTPFDFPGQHQDVEGRGINDAGEIVAYVSTAGVISAFERFADGTEKTIKVSNGPVDYSYSAGINSKGKFVVEAIFDDEKYSCYGKNARCKSDLFIFGNNYSNPRGINDRGTVVGYSGSSAWTLYKGTSAWVTYPGAKYTYLGEVNNRDIASGVWTEQDGFTNHAFLYDIKANAFQDLILTGLHNTNAIGINDGGVVAINSDEGPYLYCSTKKTCPKSGVEVPDPKIVKAQISHTH
jgi:hypothetical protein